MDEEGFESAEWSTTDELNAAANATAAAATTAAATAEVEPQIVHHIVPSGQTPRASTLVPTNSSDLLTVSATAAANNAAAPLLSPLASGGLSGSASSEGLGRSDNGNADGLAIDVVGIEVASNGKDATIHINTKTNTSMYKSSFMTATRTLSEFNRLEEQLIHNHDGHVVPSFALKAANLNAQGDNSLWWRADLQHFLLRLSLEPAFAKDPIFVAFIQGDEVIARSLLYR